MQQAGADLASFVSSWYVGEASDTLSILTGWVLIHDRNMSCTSDLVADVFSEPGSACDRDTLCPA